MNIHEHVRNGTLTEARLDTYIEADRTVLEQKDNVHGLTPLGAATVAGDVYEVLLLLKNDAKADALSKDGESPLFLAASKTVKNRARIIQLLLAKTPFSVIDKTRPSIDNNTPLMYVVRKKDLKSIRLLRKARASLTLTNNDGYNAMSLAKKTTDKAVIRALDPEEEERDFRRLVDMVVGLLRFIVAWVNKAVDGVVGLRLFVTWANKAVIGVVGLLLFVAWVNKAVDGVVGLLLLVAWVNNAVDGVVGLLLFVAWVNKAVNGVVGLLLFVALVNKAVDGIVELLLFVLFVAWVNKAVNGVVGLLFFVVWVNKAVDGVVGLRHFVALVNKAVDGVVRRMYCLDIDLNDDWDEALRFVIKVKDSVKDTLFKRFFDDKGDFIQMVAKNTMELENDTTTSLGSQCLLPKTISVSLYQQVIYCDDSSSMRSDLEDGSNKNLGRWKFQSKLVERIAKITTRVLPQDAGVTLRFINKNPPELSSNLGSDNIKEILEGLDAERDNTISKSTIGKELENKILQRLIYDKLELSTGLERPVLISILTDGEPRGEPDETLKKKIVECGEKLETNKYPRESVKFLICQIGTSPNAGNFLRTISDERIKDMVYCFPGLLNQEFATEHENEADLDRWLIKTLFKSVERS